MKGLSGVLWNVAAAGLPVNSDVPRCSLCGCVLWADEEKESNVCLLCQPKEEKLTITRYARYCAACAGPEHATRENVMIVKDRCDLCGLPNKELFRSPVRPLPGFRIAQ